MVPLPSPATGLFPSVMNTNHSDLGCRRHLESLFTFKPHAVLLVADTFATGHVVFMFLGDTQGAQLCAPPPTVNLM